MAVRDWQDRVYYTRNSSNISQPIQDKGDCQKTPAVHDLEQSSMTQR